MKIEDLDLSVRAYNCLIRAGIDTVEKLRELSFEDLARIRNMSTRAIEEIMQKLSEVKHTNADRIRAMSDEELYQFCVSLTDDGWPFACQNRPECDPTPPQAHWCNECFMKWLQQPVGGGPDDS